MAGETLHAWLVGQCKWRQPAMIAVSDLGKQLDYYQDVHDSYVRWQPFRPLHQGQRIYIVLSNANGEGILEVKGPFVLNSVESDGSDLASPSLDSAKSYACNSLQEVSPNCL